MLPSEAWDAASYAVLDCDLFFSIGTSGTVEPAASLVHHAMLNGAAVVVTNLDVTTAVSGNKYTINGPAGQILPTLVQAAWG
jgi:NAD-dependent deacetylase